MVVIRLARGGSKNRPFHSIVVADHHDRRDGRFIEQLGFYNPMLASGPDQLRVNLDRVNYWVSKGAQPSFAVTKLIVRAKKAVVATA